MPATPGPIEEVGGPDAVSLRALKQRAGRRVSKDCRRDEGTRSTLAGRSGPPGTLAPACQPPKRAVRHQSMPNLRTQWCMNDINALPCACLEFTHAYHAA